MKKFAYSVLAIVAMALFVAGGAEARGMSHGKATEKVKLAPVSGAKSNAAGEADFALAKDGATLHYVIRAKNLRDATMAHIHEVEKGGEPGPIIAWLYPATGETPSEKEGKTTGILSEGTLDAGKLRGTLKGATVKDLFAKIERGEVGIAVHTKENPAGELWGIAKAGKHMKKAM